MRSVTEPAPAADPSNNPTGHPGYDTIAGDAKDWTWVLARPCPDCGYDAADVAPGDIAGWIRAVVPLWEAVLDSAHVTERPDPATWSPLEYAAHVRDVYGVMDERLELMLNQEHPQFANWNQDATAAERDYLHQNPARVAVELAEAAERIAARLDQVTDDAWDRPGRRSNGSEFTVRTLSLYLMHDVVHHLWDNRSALDS